MSDGPQLIAPGGGRLVGLDLGARRVGVAVSDFSRRLATGSRVIHRGRDRASLYREVAAVVAEYEAVGVVVGLPLSLDGRSGPAALSAAAEVEQLREALEVPVETVDERLTTVVAAAGLRSSGRSARQARASVDQQAAAALLQTWLEQHRESQ